MILATTVGGGGGTTVTDRDAVTDRPNASVTVRVTGWEPTVANVVLGEAEVDVGGDPPVKVHPYVNGARPPVTVAENDAAEPATGEAGMGALIVTAGATGLTMRFREKLTGALPALDMVNVIGNVPATGYEWAGGVYPKNCALPSPKVHTVTVGMPPVEVLTKLADPPATIEVGPLNEGMGGGGVGATTRVRVAVLVPAPLVIVSVTRYEPAVVYTLLGFTIGEGGLPSPKSHEEVIAGPPVEVLVNETVSRATGAAGVTLNAAIGAGGLTATDRVTVLVPVSFVTVSFTG